LNLLSNALLARILEGGDSEFIIAANYMPFAARSADQLVPMKWVSRSGHFSSHILTIFRLDWILRSSYGKFIFLSGCYWSQYCTGCLPSFLYFIRYQRAPFVCPSYATL
jgi:hypothetical protein